MAYLPLSTANLPDPAIDPAQGSSPEDYFNTVLYTGDGTTANAITGVGFQPDWLWIKQRNTARGHQLVDAVRGVSLNLRSDVTNAESASGVNSFDADGFEVDITGTNGTNASGGTYVAWNWKANGSGVSNTDGSIPSTVSANTESGFSVVSYSGAIDGSTVGHGLDQAPELVIFKNRDISSGWFVMGYPTNPNFTADGSYLLLDDTLAMQNSGGNEIEIGSSVITFVDAGSSIGGANSLTDRIIAYCFHSVDGFSKFGSYTGNGSADGPFVYTGFRPSMIWTKPIDENLPWNILDSKRGPFNVNQPYLQQNSSNAEATVDYVDFLSNGFKLRYAGASPNASGDNILYIAFAENPFKYSNAR